MSSVVLLFAVAGFVLVAFLLAAALVWSIRVRRSEGNFVPAPEGWKQRRRGTPDSSAESGSHPERLRERERESAPVAEEDGPPAWMREKQGGESVSERIPIGAEPESPLKDFLRNAVPSISTVVDLGKLVQQIQAAEEKLDTPEERRAAIVRAAEQLMEQHPDNDFLRQVLESLQIQGYSAAETEPPKVINIVQTTGRNLIHVDGVEYSSVEDIPDPEKREQARRMLASLHAKKQD
jgi:hypothetical protein